MAAVIIKQKDVKRLGKEILREIFDFLHNEYILTTFEEMRGVQKVFLKNLVFNHIKTLRRKYKITEEKSDELIKPFRDNFFNTNKKVEYDPQLLKDAMEDDGVDTEGIYHTLLTLNLDMEIDGDLYFKQKAFIDIYRVFETAYSYLED